VKQAFRARRSSLAALLTLNALAGCTCDVAPANTDSAVAAARSDARDHSNPSGEDAGGGESAFACTFGTRSCLVTGSLSTGELEVTIGSMAEVIDHSMAAAGGGLRFLLADGRELLVTYALPGGETLPLAAGQSLFLGVTLSLDRWLETKLLLLTGPTGDLIANIWNGEVDSSMPDFDVTSESDSCGPFDPDACGRRLTASLVIREFAGPVYRRIASGEEITIGGRRFFNGHSFTFLNDSDRTCDSYPIDWNEGYVLPVTVPPPGGH
jgi:hypothetical protein